MAQEDTLEIDASSVVVYNHNDIFLHPSLELGKLPPNSISNTPSPSPNPTPIPPSHHSKSTASQFCRSPSITTSISSISDGDDADDIGYGSGYVYGNGCDYNTGDATLDIDSDLEDMKRPEFNLEILKAQQNGTVQTHVEVPGMDTNSVAMPPSPSTPQSSATAIPAIQSIAIKNSTDVTFGNKTHYHGPVTIKQILVGGKEKANLALINEGIIQGQFEKSKESLYPNDNQQSTSSSTTKDDDAHNKRIPLYKNCYLIGCLGLCTFTALSILIVFLITTSVHLGRHQSHYLGNHPLIGDGDDSRKNIPINSTIGDSLFNSSSVLRMVSRDEWIAQPASNELTPLELPSIMVIIAHTATEFCETQAACTFRVRFIQTFHMESRNWDDIGYNFLVGGDGSVYEGRGWGKQGAHTKGYNRRSICIAFIGTFNKIKAPQRQIEAAQKLIAEGVRRGYLDKNYRLYGHRQLIPTESPGEALYEEIRKWNNWSAEPTQV